MAIPTILSGSAGRALKALRPLQTTNTKPLDALVLVHRATPDLKSALGGEAGAALGKQLFDASRRGGTLRSAANREQVRLAFDALEQAAASTARSRVVIGSLALGGGVAGYLALRNAGSEDGQIIAPGPIGEQHVPTGTSI